MLTTRLSTGASRLRSHRVRNYFRVASENQTTDDDYNHFGFDAHCQLKYSPNPIGFRFFSTASADTSVSDRSSATSGFKPWSTHMVESHGDYREEAFLEDWIGGPLYENQKDLPRLPIPTIQETIDRFLPTALPLARSEEEKASLLAASTSFVDQAQILQDRLLKHRDNMNDSSWLQLWWNQLAYLQYRGSVVVNVSYFFQFQDDHTISDDHSVAHIQRAAAMLFATSEYRKKVCSGSMPGDKIGKKQTPLCSTPYKYLFNACRIPQPEQDTYRIYDPSRYNHAIVARNGHFFSINVVHPSTGQPLPIQTIEEQLKECIRLGDSNIGLLSSMNRDSWTKARDGLLAEGGMDMQKALEILESGAVLICLDDDAPVSREECCVKLLTGDERSGSNRWFDKSVQLIVGKNGKSGVLGEHSMMDGMVLVGLSDHLTKTTYDEAVKRSLSSEDGPVEVNDIFANVSFKTLDLPTVIDEATAEFNDVLSSQSNRTQAFHGYGSNFIKKAGHSPDAFVQMVMQLATFRLFGEQVGTYEATQVRPFLHGRTETTRSVSTQSGAFLKAMGPKPKRNDSDPVARKEKIKLLQEATSAHAQYTGNAAGAMGVDRHFFGLSMLVEEGEEPPALFSDPVYVRSKTWRTSTSHLTHPNFVNWGFGQVVPDGVGIGYSIHPESCIFNVTALKDTKWTLQLAELLEEALLEMKEMIDEDQNAQRSESTLAQ